MNVALWIAQALLAAIFLFAGLAKLVMPRGVAVEVGVGEADAAAVGLVPAVHCCL